MIFKKVLNSGRVLSAVFYIKQRRIQNPQKVVNFF